MYLVALEEFLGNISITIYISLFIIYYNYYFNKSMIHHSCMIEGYINPHILYSLVTLDLYRNRIFLTSKSSLFLH